MFKVKIIRYSYIIILIIFGIFLWISLATKVSIYYKIEGYAIGNNFIGSIKDKGFSSIENIINNEYILNIKNRKITITPRTIEKKGDGFKVTGTVDGLSPAENLLFSYKILVSSDKLLISWIIEKSFKRAIF